MAKYSIIPKAFTFDEIESENTDDAVIDYATTMDGDMSKYFTAVPVEEEQTANVKNIADFIRNHTLTADEISDILMALRDQKNVIGGKIFTQNDIKYYLDENYDIEFELNEAQLDAIQAQINPKFYNECDDADWDRIANAIQRANISIKATDIKWSVTADDVDGDDLSDEEIEAKIAEIRDTLPTSVDIPLVDLKGVTIEDYLSDEYGWLIERGPVLPENDSNAYDVFKTE